MTTEGFESTRPWLLERARLDPSGPAISDGAHEIDFATLAARTIAVATRLAALGVRRGERVGLLAAPSVRWVEILHATQVLGAVLVPLSPRSAPAEVARLVAHARPRVLAFDDGSRSSIAGLEGADRSIECTSELDAVSPTASFTIEPVDPSAVWTILYTSGTTGTPKGALLTHGNHGASARASARNLGCEPGDGWLLVLPPNHVGGLSILVRSVLDGSRVLLFPGFDADGVDAALRSGAVTLASLVPTTLARTLDAGNGAPYPNRVRAVLLGGGPIPPELVTRAKSVGLSVLPTYGLTEACSQVTTAGLGEPLRAATAGRAVHETEIRIDRPGPDGCGEILVRGPTVMRGYLDDAGATAAAIRDGWLHTGDVGRLDDDGFLQVVDRRSDLIVTGGENVYPAEVEAALLAHPDIVEAGVFAEPDPLWGQRVAAAVVLRPGRSLELEALRSWLRGRIASFKLPRSLRIERSLPRTASGKLRRGALRESDSSS